MQLPPLIKGQLIRRYQRFLAEVLLESGEEVLAHCPNTGRMQGCSSPNSTVWLSHSDNPKRRCPYTWELIQTEHSLVGVHTGRANDLVTEALQSKGLPLELNGLTLRREVRFGDSRLDIALYHGEKVQWAIEVKSVTLREQNAALFPDAPTLRGRKHLQRLIDLKKQKINSGLIFCIQRNDVDYFDGAQAIDPDYYLLLQQAQAAGVHLWALAADLSVDHITLNRQLPVQLQS